MRYFVTGATGFIGGQLVRQLHNAGHQVVALVRDPARATELAALGIELHTGDITEPESMRAPMTGADGVFHVAAWYKVGARNSEMAERINVEGTRNVLRLMRELGVPKGVYTSTLAVFSDTHGRMADESWYHAGPWLSEYDRTKWKAHYEVALPMMKEGLPLVIVQPGLVYGPGDTSTLRETWRTYLRGRLPMIPRDTAFCWGHVGDTARGHLLAMESGRVGESYIIAGPPHTIVEAMAIAERITGIPAPKLHPSPGVMKAMSGVMNVVGSVAPLPDAYTAESLRVLAGVTYLGTSEKAQRELGLRMRSLEEGLQETLAYEMKLLGLMR